MKNIPSISLLTPVYNGMPYLKQCVESILSQTYQKWELIISVDGSVDGSLEYLNTISDPRIKIFTDNPNRGIFGNLNYVISKATAPICQILCQDDYFVTNEGLGHLLKFWSVADAEIGIVRFNHNNIGRCQLTKLQQLILPSVIESRLTAMYFFVFGNIPGNLSNVSFRTYLPNKFGHFDQSYPYAGDFEFWSRVSENVDLGIENENLIFVRRHPQVASSFLNKKGELLFQKARIIQRLFDKLIICHPNHKWILKLHASLNFDAQQRYTALKYFFKGNANYLKELNVVGDNFTFLFSGPVKWLIFFLSLGGRFGRAIVAKRIIKIMKIEN